MIIFTAIVIKVYDDENKQTNKILVQYLLTIEILKNCQLSNYQIICYNGTYFGKLVWLFLAINIDKNLSSSGLIFDDEF